MVCFNKDETHLAQSQRPSDSIRNDEACGATVLVPGESRSFALPTLQTVWGNESSLPASECRSSRSWSWSTWSHCDGRLNERIEASVQTRVHGPRRGSSAPTAADGHGQTAKCFHPMANEAMAGSPFPSNGAPRRRLSSDAKNVVLPPNCVHHMGASSPAAPTLGDRGDPWRQEDPLVWVGPQRMAGLQGETPPSAKAI